MKRMILLIMIVILILPANIYSSDLIFTSAPQWRFFGVYISYYSTNRSDYPLSYVEDFLDQNYRVTYAKCSNPSYAFAIGGSAPALAFGQSSPIFKNLYFGIEFEYAASKFSDYRISNRKLNFYNINFDVGLILPTRAFPFALCGTFGAGWVKQSKYVEDEFGWASDYEYQDEGFEILSYGFCVKCSIIKNVILEYEMKYLDETHEELGDEVPGKPGWYYVDGGRESTKLGKRVSFGITFIWPLKDITGK